MVEKREFVPRKQYIVLKKFQIRYLGILLFVMFATGLICAYTVYYTGMMLLGEKLANVYPQGRLVDIVNTVNIRILFSLILIMPAIILIAVLYSHKIAGPVYKVDNTLKEIAEGNLSLYVKFRRGDELKGLAEAVNRVVESQRNSLMKEKRLANTISTSIDNLRDLTTASEIDNKSVTSEIDSLSSNVDRLKHLYSHYKM